MKVKQIALVLIKKIIYVTTHEFFEKFGIRRRPQVIQLPITGKCNSRCVTCNIWKENERKDIDPQLLKNAFCDPFFYKVEAVGINGGELTLHSDYEAVVEAILTLPHIKNIAAISNGLLTERLLQRMERTKELCRAKNVTLSLTLSIDSVGEMHDTIRGVPSAYDKTLKSLQTILLEPSKYCDKINIGCTISCYNVFSLPIVEQLSEQLNVPVEFHLAVPNKRIHTFNDADRYSVLADERARLMAIEFFYKKMEERNSTFYDIMRYFMQYDYLLHNGKERLALCNYKYQDVTIDEHMNLYLCATASDCIGNLAEASASDLRRRNKFKEVERQTFSNCNTCIHYCWQPTIKGLVKFFIFKIKKITIVYKFRQALIWKR